MGETRNAKPIVWKTSRQENACQNYGPMTGQY